MNNEGTQTINQNQTKRKKEKSLEQCSGYGKIVAKVASGVVGNAYAKPSTHEEIVITPEISDEENVVATQQPTISETTSEIVVSEDVLLATDEGVRIAQVNDDYSFSQAFSEARAQVGLGGVFEWRGRMYGTYYEEEWNNMSTEDRANFQSKIDYQSVADKPATNITPSLTTTTKTEPVIEANAEMVDEQSQDGLKVLGVETVVAPQGIQMTIAGIEFEEEQALLVDVDNNGVVDVILVDENNDGQVSENEIYDISEVGVRTAYLQQQMVATYPPDLYMVNGEDMPDYINDTDINSMA